MPEATTYPTEGLVPYDPSWVPRYAALATTLRAVLGPGWVVEHIGSTSVPGLLAKPVIDLALRLPTGERLERHAEAFAGLGWSAPVDLGPHRCLFHLDGTVRRAIAHVFPAERWPTAHQRVFAAWLREHPQDRDAYARLKKGLHDSGVWGRAYTDAKATFVEDVVNRARASAGLGPVALRSPTRG